MPGIGIITNPHSKLNKRNPSRIDLLGYIVGEKGTFEITRSLEHLSEVAQQFKEKDIEILAINGGDGTVSQTLTAFQRAYGEKPLPRIALLRGGTMNVVANNIGTYGPPEKLLAELLELVSRLGSPDTVTIPTLSVEGRIGFVYADGSSTHILEEFYKRKSGVVGALWLGLRLSCSALLGGTLFKRIIRGRDVTLAFQGFDSSRHTSLSVLAASVRKLPLGLPFFGLLGRGRGAFQVLSITSRPSQLLWQLPFVMLHNREKESLGKISYCCDSVTLRSPHPIRYTLDGELYAANGDALELKLGPAIEFIKL